MIRAIEKNLNRGIYLLNTISDSQYSDKTVAPYFSSIGCHIRHILDMFTCVFDGQLNGTIDLTNRKRNQAAELQCKAGIHYFEDILQKLGATTPNDLNKQVFITDDLGLGKETTQISFGAALMQAHSHAIHHYASIGYMIHQLEIELPDNQFGFNPTTPKKVCKH